MNRTELARRVQAELPFPLDLNKTEIVLDALFRRLADEMRAGGEVKIREFGTFHVQTLVATRRRAFRGGELTVIPARRRVRFQPSASLRPADLPPSAPESP